MTLKFLMYILGILMSTAFITILERKVLGYMMIRKGPLKVSLGGILQPVADAIKLASKQENKMVEFSKLIYHSSSMMFLLTAFVLWMSMFDKPSMMTIKFSMILIMLMLTLNTLITIMMGWSTGSKYPLVGSMRTIAQLISYEMIIGMCLISMIFLKSSYKVSMMNLTEMSMMVILTPLMLMFWVPSMLADLNRTPYDFSESESELVSGFNTEFGSKSFTMIFLSEYSNITFFSTLTMFMFLSTKILTTKMILISSVMFLIIWIRSTMPRFRYDKLMNLAWKFLIPMTTLYLMSLMMLQ